MYLAELQARRAAFDVNAACVRPSGVVEARHRVPSAFGRIFVLTATLTASACIGEDVATRGQPDCKRLDYPCAAADVDPAVAREGIRIADGVLDRFNRDGGEEALEWLRAQPRVVHVLGDGRAFRFRLEGGRPVWVLTAQALGYADGSTSMAVPPPASTDPSAAGFTNVAGLLLSAGRWLAAEAAATSFEALPPAPLVEVVGRDRDGDGKVSNRDPRHALILDPFHWEWSRLTSYSYREGDEVRRMLLATSGFAEGEVRYLRDHEATESAFTGWDKYDVVHFSGHGHQLCEHDACFSALFTGDTVSSSGVFDDSDLGLGRETGVMEVWDPVTDERLRKRHVAVGREWFEAHYAHGKLSGTLVYLSGCGTMNPGSAFLPDFLASLLGDSGATAIGWTGVVPGAPAQAAALAFYEQADKSAQRAGEVLSNMQKDGFTAAVNSEGGRVALRAGSARGEGFTRAPARLREVVALHVPVAGRMTDGPQPRKVLRGSPGDARNDTLSVDVVLEGVQASELDQWSVDLVLGGRVIRRGLTPADGRVEGRYRYRIPVRDIDIGGDLVEGRSDTLEAVARLPEGGESRYIVLVRGATCYWTADVTGLRSGHLEGPGVKVRPTPVAMGVNLYAVAADGRTYGPNDPSALTFSLHEEPDVGSFTLGEHSLMTLWGGGSLVLSYSQTGSLQLTTVKHDERSGELIGVEGEFTVEFPGVVRFPEVEGPLKTEEGVVEVAGEFRWRATCPHLPGVEPHQYTMP